MKIKQLSYDFSVCKVKNADKIDLSREFTFAGKTDEENSLVCKTEDVPQCTTEREDNWKAFRIEGVLNFSLIGILAKISQVLSDNKIGIFAVSTFNTDYIFVKSKDFESALSALKNAGYEIV